MKQDRLTSVIASTVKNISEKRSALAREREKERNEGVNNMARAKDPATQGRVAQLVRDVQTAVGAAMKSSESFSALLKNQWPTRHFLGSHEEQPVVFLKKDFVELTRGTYCTVYAALRNPNEPLVVLIVDFPHDNQLHVRLPNNLPGITAEFEAALEQLQSPETLATAVVNGLEEEND